MTAIATRSGAGMLALATCLLVGCVGGQPATSGGPGAGAMTVDQLSAALTGNSVVATLAGGGSYCAFHSTQAQSSGSLLVTGIDYEGDSAAPYRGLYRVEPQPNAGPGAPGFVCYSYPDAGVFAECRMLRTTGSQVAVLDRNGQTYAIGQIQPGDACNADI